MAQWSDALVNEDQLRQLLILALAGDSRAYAAFLRDLTIHLRAFLRKRLARLPEEVEDLLQELLLAIHNQRHTYDRSRPVTVWVQAIARYKLIDMLRCRSRVEALQDEYDDESELFAHSAQQSTDARLDVAALLEILPDRQRLPILYVKVEGASIADTAARTGMSASAVKVGIHRGLKVLAAKIRSAP
jgi:RNA polymerase sigma-70 factor (ECF subfamily)